MQRTVEVRLRAAVGNYMASMSQAAAATRALKSEVANTARSSKADMEKVGMAMTIAGGAMVGSVALATKTFADFDQQMSAVGAVAQTTAGNMDKLRQAAIDAGADTAFSASEAALAQEELVKAGISVSDVLGGALAGSLDLAAAGQLDLADAATVAAQAMNVFKLEGSDVGHIADVLAAAANKSAADVADLGQGLRQGGLVAAQTGLTFEETAAALSLFADNALVGSDAGTSLKTMLQRLTPQSDEAAGLMAELGFSAYDAQGNFIGLAELSGELQKALGDMTVEQRNSAMATLFGSDAVRGANVLYEAGTDIVNDYVAAVDDQGAASEMAAAKLDNLKGDLEELGGSIETALINSGSVGNDVLREMVQLATGAVNVYNDLPGPVQATATGLVAVGGGATLVSGGLLLALPRIVETKDALAALRASGSRIPGMLGRMRAGLAGGAGVAGAMVVTAMAASGLADALSDALDDREEDVDDLRNALAALGTELEFKLTVDGLSDAFGDDLSGLNRDLDRLTQPTRFEKVEDFLATVNPFADAPGAERARDRIAALDDAITQIAENQGPEAAARQLGMLADAAGLNGYELTRLQELLPDFNTAIDTTAVHAGGLPSVLNPAAEGFEETGSAAAAAVDPIQQFGDAISGVLGIFLDAASADIAWEAALDDMVETIKESTKVLDENGEVIGEQAASFDRNTEAGRKNEAAIIDAIEAAADHGQALMDQGSGAEAAADAIAGHVSQLRDELIEAGVAREAVDLLLASYNATPEQIFTRIIAQTDEAEAALDRLAAKMSRLSGSVGYVRVGTTSVVPKGVTRHDGGWADRTGQHHTGPMRHDEVPAVLQWGEFVMNREDAAAMDGYGLLPTGGRSAQDVITDIRDGRVSASSSPTVHVAGGGGGGSSRTFQVAKGAVQVTAPDSRRAGAEAAFQVDRLVREMGG